jgi:hypothetical protein
MSAIMSVVAEKAHVTLSGDITGEYLVETRRHDGRLVLVPDTSADTILARYDAKPLTDEDFERHLGDLPTDDEG